ncbi:MAG TPA: ATP-binding cassette domain-containing protein, partial [Propionicimonas sp.]|nr:ATP-binding cassette domain-containing protein [Propionicimonas sp.]HQA79059.1 ATP-binding cassette domain-containing protein [Propionicimonas sp.]
MSASLFCSGLAASYGARPLFSGLELTLASGVTALVGPNGSGKTTLLRILAGEHQPDAGTVRLAPMDATIGYLPQSLPEPKESALDYALRRTGVGPAGVRFERAAAALADGGDPDDYAHALERWLALGGADLETRLAATLDQLGLEPALDRPLGTLSGGQAARVALASILVSQYDVLLLDEPTNNLDAAGLKAMTGFVTGQRSPVLIASHDRAFLDDVATSVVELDLHQQ